MTRRLVLAVRFSALFTLNRQILHSRYLPGSPESLSLGDWSYQVTIAFFVLPLHVDRVVQVSLVLLYRVLVFERSLSDYGELDENVPGWGPFQTFTL